MERCFACDKPLGKAPQLVGCKDKQDVHVGINCYRKIKAAGAAGYQPPKGGPRLYLLQFTDRLRCARFVGHSGDMVCDICGSMWSPLLHGLGWLPLSCPDRPQPST